MIKRFSKAEHTPWTIIFNYQCNCKRGEMRLPAAPRLLASIYVRRYKNAPRTEADAPHSPPCFLRRAWEARWPAHGKEASVGMACEAQLRRPRKLAPAASDCLRARGGSPQASLKSLCAYGASWRKHSLAEALRQHRRSGSARLRLYKMALFN